MSDWSGLVFAIQSWWEAEVCSLSVGEKFVVGSEPVKTIHKLREWIVWVIFLYSPEIYKILSPVFIPRWRVSAMENVCNFDMHWWGSHSSAVPDVVFVAVESVRIILLNATWVIGVAAVIVLAPPFAVIGKVVKV